MRRKTLWFLALLLIVLSVGLQAQFARTYGGTGSDIARKILPTSDGGFIVFGNTDSSTRAWVIKLAADGSVQWEKAYGGSGYYTFNSICRTADDGFLMTGGDGLDVWLIKTNGLGEIEWQKMVGTAATDYASTVCQASDSGYFVVGHTVMYGVDNANADVWVIKVSAQGDVVWQKTYGTGGWDWWASAEATSDGGCVIAAREDAAGDGRDVVLVFKIDSLGAVLWQKTYQGVGYDDCKATSIRRTDDGGFVVAGWLNMISQSSVDMFVFKLGATGTLEWAKSYGRPGDAGANDICPTLDGGSIVTGNSSGDIVILKLQANGDIEWQKAYGGVFAEEGRAVAQTPGGDYLAAGFTTSYGVGAEDFCVLRVLVNGNLGSCRFCKNLSLLAATPEVNQADINLSILDTAAAPQTADLTATDTSGNSQTYRLCSSKKVLTIYLSGVSTASAISPRPGTYLRDSGDSVSIQATPVITINDTKYDFSSWDGDFTDSTNPLTFTITDDTSVRANYYEEWGGEGGGGTGTGKYRCFIATAAYQSPLHPAVKLLQDFRDRRLLANPLGRAFVSTYYRLSPTMARVISRSAPLRLITRIFLVPVIGAAALVLTLGWPLGLAIMVAGPFAVIRKFRSRRKRKALIGVGP
jgi:hypothetical protein